MHAAHSSPFFRRAQPLLPCLIAFGALLTGCASDPKARQTWSNPASQSVNKDFPAMHGFFNAEPVSVTLRDLPAHKWMTVKFKLILTGTWDGSFLPWGPDLWTLQVRGGQQLMMTSFSSMGARSANYVQAYPDDYPWGLHYAYTGGLPLDGKPFRSPDETGMAVSRVVYPIEVSFPHEGGDLTLDFGAVFDDPPQEKQCWGVAGFEYALADAPAPIDATELYRLWDELAARDSVRANAAMWKLISAGEPAAKFVAAKVDALEDTDASQYNRPEGLRMRRAQKVLRIIQAPGTTASGSALTYKLPEMNMRTPQASP